MRIQLKPNSKVSVVRRDSKYRVQVTVDTGTYIHLHEFCDLEKSVEVAHKVMVFGSIDEQYWDISDDLEQSDTFLVRGNSAKLKAHLWQGLDTWCRMYSTGGLAEDYELSKLLLGRKVCTMCANQRKKYSK